ncbi:MAG: hypothetical protein KC931_23545, partial [Candidatus Omnitrophica bacterium]|nr:hypothetical protein [Candidatus Omnitrophota bacterium]
MRTYPFRLATLLPLCLLPMHPVESQTPTPVPKIEPKVVIDLDRDADGIQSTLDYDPNANKPIRGAIVLVGSEEDEVSDFSIEIEATKSDGGEAIDCKRTTLLDGEILSNLGINFCADSTFMKSQLFVSPPIAVGTDEFLHCFEFDLFPTCEPGEFINLEFTKTEDNPQRGLRINGAVREFGPSFPSTLEIATEGATIYCRDLDTTRTPLPTPTNTPFILEKVVIDLDRNQEGIQSTLDYNTRYEDPIRGGVRVLGSKSDGVNYYAIEIAASKEDGEAAIDCEKTEFFSGEVASSLESGSCGSNLLGHASRFEPRSVGIGRDGELTCFEFDLYPICKPGEIIELDFSPWHENQPLGIYYNDIFR